MINNATKVVAHWAVINCQSLDEDINGFVAESQLMPLSMMLAVLFRIDTIDDCKPALHHVDWAYVVKQFKHAE